MTLKSTFWDNKRKYFTLAGVLLVLLIIVATILITGKMRADNLADTYSKQLPTYVQSLTLTDKNRLRTNTVKLPSLPKTIFAFTSPKYQAAAAKQAAIEESVAMLNDLDKSFAMADKNELRTVLFYYQSSFYFDTDGPRLEALTKIRQSFNMPATEKAGIYASMFEARAKAATDYITLIEKKPLRKPLYEKEALALVETLRAYKKAADTCKAKMNAAKSNDDVDAITKECNETVDYGKTAQIYDYIVYYPTFPKLTTPPTLTLITQIQKQAEQSYDRKNTEEARIEASLSNRAQIAKTLLPTSINTTYYREKIDTVLQLNKQSQDEVAHAAISRELKDRYQKRLSTITEAITSLYTKRERNQDGVQTSPLTDGILEIMKRERTKDDKDTSASAFEAETKKRLAALNLPDALKKELQLILPYYDKAAPYLKKGEAFNEAAFKIAEDTTRDEADYIAMGEKSTTEFDKAQAYLDTAYKEVIKKIQGKLNTSPYPSEQAIKLYDGLLRP
ncbi:MAG TPA: hypothetical protein VGE13_00065 [Candidatus Saccharimonadales bacterium]